MGKKKGVTPIPEDERKLLDVVIEGNRQDMLYIVLDEYADVETQYKEIGKRRDELNTRLKELITVPNEAQVIRDIMFEKQVTQASTLKADLIRTLLKQEGREDLIEAATETNDRITLKVKRLKKATV